jgi:hypothetical protein
MSLIVMLSIVVLNEKIASTMSCQVKLRRYYSSSSGQQKLSRFFASDYCVATRVALTYTPIQKDKK